MEETMAGLRYALALLLLVAVPAALLYWLLIHPFVACWRRLGPRTTYLVVCTPVVALMLFMASLRRQLLASSGDFSWWLALPGLLCLAASAWLKLRLAKDLPVPVLVGLPELAPGRADNLLRQTGLYARVRHPRYLQMTLALLGSALIANYPAASAAFLVWCLGIALVARLEERELLARFGAAYQDYCQRVPRFLPRWRIPSSPRREP